MKKIGSERDGGFAISQAKWQMMKIPVSSKREKRERNRSFAIRLRNGKAAAFAYGECKVAFTF
jgi:hypothetical protein